MASTRDDRPRDRPRDDEEIIRLEDLAPRQDVKGGKGTGAGRGGKMIFGSHASRPPMPDEGDPDGSTTD
jgi:hypothetical protein